MFATTAFLQCLTPVSCCPARGFQCIFDQVRPKSLGKNTAVHYESRRAKRSSVDLFQPIRITASILDLEEVVDTTDVARVRTIIDGAISIIRKILIGDCLHVVCLLQC